MISFFVLCFSYEDPDKCLLLYGDDQVGVRGAGEGRRGQSALIQRPEDHLPSFQGEARGREAGGSICVLKPRCKKRKEKRKYCIMANM